MREELVNNETLRLLLHLQYAYTFSKYTKENFNAGQLFVLNFQKRHRT